MDTNSNANIDILPALGNERPIEMFKKITKFYNLELSWQIQWGSSTMLLEKLQSRIGPYVFLLASIFKQQPHLFAFSLKQQPRPFAFINKSIMKT